MTAPVFDPAAPLSGQMWQALKGVPLRACHDCELLCAGVCGYYGVRMPYPSRPCRCARFVQRDRLFDPPKTDMNAEQLGGRWRSALKIRL